jgi:hypothetical protein
MNIEDVLENKVTFTDEAVKVQFNEKLQMWESLKALQITELDLTVDSTELQTALLRVPEVIRVLNLKFFEIKREKIKQERKLERYKASIILNLDQKEYRNEQKREAAVVDDKSFTTQQDKVDELSIILEEVEQQLWSYRHFESNLRSVAELRIREMKL